MVLIGAPKSLKRFEIYSICHIFRLFSTHFVRAVRSPKKSIFREFEANFDSEKYNVSIKNAITEIRILIRISKILIF